VGLRNERNPCRLYAGISVWQTMRKRRVFKQLWDIRNIFRELQTKRMPMKYLKEYLNVQKN